jgi:hypothetical protein
MSCQDMASLKNGRSPFSPSLLLSLSLLPLVLLNRDAYYQSFLQDASTSSIWESSTTPLALAT